jgi:hypothetical protein
MLAPCLIQEFSNVGKILDVTALVGGEGNGVCVLLNGTINHGLRRLIVAKVNHFCSRGLNQATHDVDGGIVAVKQRGCGDDTDWTSRGLEHRFFVRHDASTHLWFINSRVNGCVSSPALLLFVGNVAWDT